MPNFQPAFTLAHPQARILFGAGSSSAAGDEVERLGARRTLVVSTPGGARHHERLSAALGARQASIFAGALPHGPGEVTEAALARVAETTADAILSVGGGSAIGLGKILACRTGLPHLALPTTYSGVEAAPGLEESRGGAPLRWGGQDTLPETVIYDPDLTRDLSWPDTLATGMAALSHAVAGLAATGRTPLSRLTATEAVWVIAAALPNLRDMARDAGARAEMLYASWLAGLSRAAGEESDQHQLAAALAGRRGLPEAVVHGVLLPHAVAVTANADDALLDPLRDVFGDPPAQGILDFARAMGVPESLAALGLEPEDLHRAADLAAVNRAGPSGATRARLMAILDAAWVGRLAERGDASAGTGT